MCNFIRCCLLTLCCMCFATANAYACHPTLLCVDDLGSGNYKAHFGFVGSESYIAIGTKNKFSGSPAIAQDQGQGTNFSASSVADHVRVNFSGSASVTWFLRSSSVTANKNSKKCATPTPTPTPTCSPSPTKTPTPTPTKTPTPTPTKTPTPSPTPCEPTPTPSPTPTPKKVLICHLTGESSPKAINISVDESSVPAHLAHGDHLGACEFDCAGNPFGLAVIDQCGVCGGDNSTCKDCAGVPNGTSKPDLCGVCNGDNSTCKDCAGTPNGSKVKDQCGVCGGDNSTCKDCAGVPNGEKTIDLCGVCGGQSNTCLDCSGTPNGGKTVDACGMCGGDGLSCVDCNGVPNGSSLPDLCGVCNGSNSCLDCAGLPNGGTIVDKCGVCGGDGGKLTKIKINKRAMIKLANTLLTKKTLPYFAGAVKCNSAFSKMASRGSANAKQTHKLIVDAINSLVTEVRLCPGECAKDINKKLLVFISKLAKLQYKFAADAQHAGRAACKNDGPGLALTKPIEVELQKLVNSCPNKVCHK
jgi:hypothetical protein